jgi:predicted SnoaL-like aldol condensation-catalyzing enzyme
MSTPRPEQELVLRLVDEVVNGGRLELIAELVHPDFYDHGATPSRSCGPDGFRATVLALHASYAGFRLEPRDVIAADGKVVVRATASGRRLDGSGREWSTQQIHIFRLAQDRVIEHWASTDGLATTRADEANTNRR